MEFTLDELNGGATDDGFTLDELNGSEKPPATEGPLTEPTAVNDAPEPQPMALPKSVGGVSLPDTQNLGSNSTVNAVGKMAVSPEIRESSPEKVERSKGEIAALEWQARTGQKNRPEAHFLSGILPFNTIAEDNEDKIRRMKDFADGKPFLQNRIVNGRTVSPEQAVMGEAMLGPMSDQSTLDAMWAQEARYLGVPANEAGRANGESREDYRKRLKDAMKTRFETAIRNQAEARKELERTDRSITDRIVVDGAGSVGYSLEFLVGGALMKGVKGAELSYNIFTKSGLGKLFSKSGMKELGKVFAADNVKALPATISGSQKKYRELTRNEYGFDRNGDVVIASKGDEEGLGTALKAIGATATENFLENSVGRFTRPGMKRLMQKVGQTGGIGRAINDIYKAYDRATELTGFGDILFEELPEENVQYFFNDILGWGKKQSEYKGFWRELDAATSDGGQYTLQGQFNTALAMVMQMGVQAATAGGVQGLKYADAAHSAGEYAEATGLTKETVDGMSKEQKVAYARLHNAVARRFKGDPKRLQEALDRCGKFVGMKTDEMAKQATYKVEGDLAAYGVQPKRFQINAEPDENGVPRPKFEKRPYRNPLTGEETEVNAMVNEETDPETGDVRSSVSVIDHGDGTYSVEDSTRPGHSYEADELWEAIGIANLYTARNQKRNLDNDRKKEYARQLLETKYKRNTLVFDGVSDVLRFFENGMRQNGGSFLGISDLGEIFGVNGSGELELQGGKTSGGFTLPDGSGIAVILDNIASPADMNRVLSHEPGHASAKKDEAARLEFLKRADPNSEYGRILKDLKKRNAATGNKWSDDYIVGEAFSQWLESRGHNPTLMQRIRAKTLGKFGKVGDAELEVLANQIERETESGAAGAEDFDNRVQFIGGGYGLGEAAPSEEKYLGGKPAEKPVITVDLSEAPAAPEAPTDKTSDDGYDDDLPPPDYVDAPDGAPQPLETAPLGAASAEGATSRPNAENAPQAASRASDTTPTENGIINRVDEGGADGAKPVTERSIVEKLTDKAPAQEVPIADIEVSDSRLPQFKEGADPTTGEVEPLTGEPYDLVANPIVMMEFKDGKKVVVTGRHRFGLYKRAGRKTIAARVIREADGWSVKDAMAIDAIGNIIDEKGTEKDYVRYFDEAKPSRGDAEDAGFLDRPKGRRAFGIYEGASEDTKALIDWEGGGEDGKISVEQAAAIAEAAPVNANPRNGAVQRILTRKALDGVRGKKLAVLARSLAEEAKNRKDTPKADTGTQLDLFTSEEDVALLATEEKRADYRVKRANEYRRIAEVLRTAVRKGGKLDLNAEYAKELGITDPKDRSQLKAARDRAVERANYWENAVALDAADKAEMDAAIGVKPAANNLVLDGGTAKELAEEERKRKEKAEIEKRQNAPLKGGAGEVGQSLLDLGGAEGEDLFNRTERTEATASATPEKSLAVEKPSAAPRKRTVVMKNAEEEKKAKAALDAIDFDTDLTSDVGNAEKYGAWLGKYRLPHSKARQDEWSRRNSVQFDSDFDYEKFGRLVTGVGKLVDVLTESGHKDFKSLATYISENDAAKYQRAKPVLQDVWNAVARQKGLARVSDSQADGVFAALDSSSRSPAATPEEVATTVPFDKLDEKKDADEIARRISAAADAVKALIDKGEKFDRRALEETVGRHLGGSVAEGSFTPKDAFNILELAVNRKLLDMKSLVSPTANASPDAAVRAITRIRDRILAVIPTQTVRSDEQIRMQQFSTPPTEAFCVNWVANLNGNDTVLEPSAGIGGIAVFAKNAGVKSVIANELAESRRKVLDELGVADNVYGVDAAKIWAHLYPDVNSGKANRPTVVVMNPPFSSSVVSGRHDTIAVGGGHIEAALDALAPGGRLVAVVGSGMSHNSDSKSAAAWWKKVSAKYRVMANVRVNGKEYAKYGTDFDNNIIVIDKVAPDATTEPVYGTIESLDEFPALMEGVKNARPEVNRKAEPARNKQEGRGGAKEAPAGLEPRKSADNGRSGGNGSSSRPVGGRGRTNGNAGSEGKGVVGESSRGNARSGDKSASGRNGRDGSGSGKNTMASGRDGLNDVRNGADGRGEAGGRADDGSGLLAVSDLKSENPQGGNEEVRTVGDGTFAEYKPSKLNIPGMKPHPGEIVESAAMASVKTPDITYSPRIPKELVEKGQPSAAQLEVITLAGQAHEQVLPNGERRGFFTQDGTGMGKGTEIGGVICDNWNHGRKKAIWISKNQKLFPDAQRDLSTYGLQGEVFKFGDKKKSSNGKSIAFLSYDTLETNASVSDKGDVISNNGDECNFQRLVEWFGKDYDGVIVFDESHMMANVEGKTSKRGKTEGAKRAIIAVKLQEALPNARVLYASATGATEVSHLACLPRLGLWGEGTSFKTKGEFIDKISKGGLSMMEMVARDMKASGLTLSRTLTMEGVVNRPLVHNLSPDQTRRYDECAAAWQEIYDNIFDTVASTGEIHNGKRIGQIVGQMKTSQQRFFNSLLTSMMLPSVIPDMKRNLADGKSVVIQLTETNEAALKRAIGEGQKNEDFDPESLDTSPREIIRGYVERYFPTFVYTEVEGEDGKKSWVIAKGADGKPLQDPAAVERKRAILDKIDMMRMDGSPLDAILSEFGYENVAEVTGRKKRIERVEKDGEIRADIVSRSDKKGEAEANEFNDGKRRILIFSEAGGTGKSYHASRTYQNQQQRVHYLLQAGWSAPPAIQGLGRTNRTNQASKPEYVLCTTDVKGHLRFISSVARRLQQMGSLTSGDRSTAGNGVFNDDQNIEDVYSKRAIEQIFTELYYNEPSEFDRVSRMFGYVRPKVDTKTGERTDKNLLIDEETRDLDREAIPSVTDFLNIMLHLRIADMNRFFDRFMQTRTNLIEMAKESGKYDPGLEKLIADKVVEKGRTQIYEDPSTGSKTEMVELGVSRKSKKRPYSTVWTIMQGSRNHFFAKNKSSGKLYAFAERSQTVTDAQGVIHRTFYRYAPDGTSNIVRDYDVRTDAKGNYEIVKSPEAKWTEEYEKVPDLIEDSNYYVTGAILPVFGRLGINEPRVKRIEPTGKKTSYLGLEVPNSLVDQVMANFGVGGSGAVNSPEAVYRKIVNDGKSVELQRDGWKLKRARVNYDYAIELVGLEGPEEARRLERLGYGRFDRTTGKPRFFIPRTAEGVKKFLADYPAKAEVQFDTDLGDTHDIVADGKTVFTGRFKSDAQADGYARHFYGDGAKAVRKETVDFDTPLSETLKPEAWGDLNRKVNIVGVGVAPWEYVKGTKVSEHKATLERMAYANIEAQQNHVIDPETGNHCLVIDGTRIRISKSGLFHSADRRLQNIGNAIANIGDVLNNSVSVPNTGGEYSYRIAETNFGRPEFVLVTLKNVDGNSEVVDLKRVYSVNVKAGNAAQSTTSTSVPRLNEDSIANLFDVWKGLFYDGVVKHLESLNENDGRPKIDVRNWHDVTISVGNSANDRRFFDLFNHFNRNEESKRIADKVFPLAEKVGFSIWVDDLLGDGTFGYSYGNVIYFNQKWFSDKSVSPQAKADVILHEFIHNVTCYAIDAVYGRTKLPNGVTVSKELREAVDDLETIYAETEPLLKRSRATNYAQTITLDEGDPFGADKPSEREHFTHEARLQEFLAELAVPKVRNKLKQQNLWERVVNGVRRVIKCLSEMLGDGDLYGRKAGDTQRNALDVALDNLDKFLDNLDYKISGDQYTKDLEAAEKRAKNRLRRSKKKAAEKGYVEINGVRFKRGNEVQFDTDLTPEENERLIGFTNDEVRARLKEEGIELGKHVSVPDERTNEKAESLASNLDYMRKFAQNVISRTEGGVSPAENKALMIYLDTVQEHLNAVNAALGEISPEDANGDRKGEYVELKKRHVALTDELTLAGMAKVKAASVAGGALRSQRDRMRPDRSFAGIVSEISQAAGVSDGEKIPQWIIDEAQKVAKEFENKDKAEYEYFANRWREFSKAAFASERRAKKFRDAAKSTRNPDDAKTVVRDYEKALARLEVYAKEGNATIEGIEPKFLKSLSEFHIMTDPSLVEDPETAEEKVMDAVTKDVQAFFPLVGIDTVRRIITDYGHNHKMSKRETQAIMNELKRQSLKKVQLDVMRTENRLPDVTGGIDVPPSDERLVDVTRALTKEANEEKKLVPEGSERALKSYVETTLKSLDNRIRDLRRAIEIGEKIPRKERRVVDDVRIIQKRKELEEVRKTYDELFKTSRTMTPEQRIAAAERATLKVMEGLAKEIADAENGVFTQKGRATPVESDLLKDRRKQIEEMRKRLKEMKKAAYMYGRTPAEIMAHNRRIIQNLENRLMEKATWLETGKIPTKPEKLPMTKKQKEEYEALRRQNRLANRKLAELRQRALTSRMTAPKRIISEYVEWFISLFSSVGSLDVSGPGRQGIKASSASPSLANRAMRTGLHTMVNEDFFNEVNEAVLSDPVVKEAVEKYGLFLRSSDIDFQHDVEIFRARDVPPPPMIRRLIGAIDALPVVGKAGKGLRERYARMVEASERHYVTTLNILCAETYKRMLAGIDSPSGFQKRKIASLANLATGSGMMSNDLRANINGVNDKYLKHLIWSPSLKVAQIQNKLFADLWTVLFGAGEEGEGKPTLKQIGQVEKEAIKLRVRSELTLCALGFLLAWTLGPDDWWGEFKDMARKAKDAFVNARPVEFLKHAFRLFSKLHHPVVGKGTHIDLEMGSLSAEKAIGAVISSEYETATGRKMTPDMFGYNGPFARIARYVQGSLAPAYSTAFNLVQGRDYLGDPFGLKEALMSMFPLAPRDMVEIAVNEEWKNGAALIGILSSLVGAGGNYWDESENYYKRAVNGYMAGEVGVGELAAVRALNREVTRLKKVEKESPDEAASARAERERLQDEIKKAVYEKKDLTKLNYIAAKASFEAEEKAYREVENDSGLTDEEREERLAGLRAENPLLADGLREDLAADAKEIRRLERKAKEYEKENGEPDKDALAEIEEAKGELLKKIRKSR